MYPSPSGTFKVPQETPAQLQEFKSNPSIQEHSSNTCMHRLYTNRWLCLRMPTSIVWCTPEKLHKKPKAEAKLYLRNKCGHSVSFWIATSLVVLPLDWTASMTRQCSRRCPLCVLPTTNMAKPLCQEWVVISTEIFQ